MKGVVLVCLLLAGCAGDRTLGIRENINLQRETCGTLYGQGTLLKSGRAKLGAYAEVNTKNEGSAQLDLSCRW